MSLPRSVVTGIVSPVLTGIYGPIETSVNGTLAALSNPLLGLLGLPAPLSVNVNGLLTQAASGGNIGLNAVARDGTLVGPGSTCNASANSFMLDNPAGLAIGGNMITGLGAAGQQASAGEINSIAFGNRAATNGAALGSIAIGPNATVGAGGSGSVALGSASSATAANSVALGAGSVAARGPLAGYTAPLLAGTFASAGEISVGAPGAGRQITNVAPGSAPTDAVNLQQLLAVSASVPTDPVVYDNATHGAITLTGAAGTQIHNVAPGVVAATSADAVNGAQLFATNSQVSNNTTAISTIQVQLGNLTVAGGSPVQYSNPGSPTTANGGIPTNDTTLVGAAAGPVGVHNVAGGVIAAGSTDAVNGGQLATTNLAVAAAQSTANGAQTAANGAQTTANSAQTAANGAQSTANGAQATATTALGLASNSVQYDNAQHSSVTFSNAGGSTRLSNVSAGALTATSTDAVNGSQLFALSQQVASGGTPNAVTYTDASQKTVALGGAGGTTVTNVSPATLNATSTDAVNGAQLFATNGQVQTNTTAISNLNTQVATNTSSISNLNTQVSTNTSNISTIQVQLGNLTVAGGSPLQYSNPGSPTASNGGIPTNDTTLVGAAAGPVGVHNVANGTLAAGSTDAVNGGQLAATNQAVATAQGTANTALTAANGAQTTAVAAQGTANTALMAANTAQTTAVAAQGTANTALTTANTAQTTAVAAQGTANTALTTANGAQTTAVAAQGTASTALGLAANSVQYDNAQHSSVTFDTGGAPTRLSNVAAGTAANDAVNYGQLQSVVNGAMSSAISTAVTQANSYTDSRITALSYDLRSARREARSGSAAALAAAALPQPTEGGKTMIAGGVGVYAGRTAFAVGAARATSDGRSVFRLGVTYDASQHVGANAGAGFQF